ATKGAQIPDNVPHRHVELALGTVEGAADAPNPAEIGSGFVDPLENRLVVEQCFTALPHRGEVQAGGALICGGAVVVDVVVGEEPTLPLEPSGELGVGQRVEKSHHAGGDGGVLDALDHAFGDRVLLGVEAHDEAAVHEDASLIDLADALGEASASVLSLLHRHQGLSVGAFDPHEDGEEVRALHQVQEHLVVGQVDRGLGRELEGIVPLREPRGERGEELLESLLVADEIVVDEVDVATVADPVELLELGERLRGSLGAGNAAVELDDVAELAVERAAARKLHADVEILVELEKVEARHWALGDVRLELLAFEDPALRPLLPRLDQPLDDALGFTEYQEVGALVDVRTRGGVGAADDDWLAEVLAHPDDLEG